MEQRYNLYITYTENGFRVEIGTKHLVSGSIDRLCELIANEVDNQFKITPKDVCLCICLNDVLPVNAV
ncbi:hypothetical protein GCM10023187_46280 [Nibrella viscosa]|uniref:Uncharacterized protein n=1 Tax=Nibrella viscosa TaxID=1084524 RepID=A0ABP8KTT5_9BACT